MTRFLIGLWLTCLCALAQDNGAGVLSTWEPRHLTTKAALVASYDPGNSSLSVSSPTGWAGGSLCNVLSNEVTAGTADLVQATAANQPWIGRADNCGNLLKQSDSYFVSTAWARNRINAAGANDTGATGAGSFANTARTTDPAGGNTADFLQEDNTVSNSHYMAQSVTLPAGAIRFGIAAKAAGRNYLRLFGFLGSDSLSAFYDIAAGTNGTASNGGAATGAAGSISSLGNSWYWIQLSGTMPAAGSIEFRMFICTNITTVGYDGDNTSGVYLWGASLTRSSWTAVTGTDAAHGYIATANTQIMPGLSGRPAIYFNGSSNYVKAAAFTLNQPTEIYSLVNPWTWTLNDTMFDGNTLASGQFYQSATAPKVRQTAGTITAEFTPATAMAAWRVYISTFDGASSSIQENTSAAVTADAGTGNMGGFSFGAAGTAGTTFWNGLLARSLICNKTNAPAEKNYLAWGLLKQGVLY